MPWLRMVQEPLQPLLDMPTYDTSLLSQRRSSAECLISYDGNLYSVPAGYYRQLLPVREPEQNELLIYALCWKPKYRPVQNATSP